MTAQNPPPVPRCYVHPDRVAGSVCRRCNRPICPECMHEAPVGWQCPACTREGHRRAPEIRWRPASRGRLGNTRLTPAVLALIAVNVAVFLWEQAHYANVVDRFAMWPVGVHSEGQWYRLITAAFLHANLEHILFNMVTLAIVGSPVEAELGKVRFVALYFVSALGGSVASYLLSRPFEAGVGASGAIFGVMGAYFVLARRRRWETGTIAALIVINIVISFAVPIIDWRAHLGGLFTGAVVGFGMGRTSEVRRLAGRAGGIAAGVGIAAAAAAVLAVLVTLPPGQVNL